MAAKAVHGDVSCRDRMLAGCRCSGPLVPCGGGAHAPLERRLRGFEIWLFKLLSNILADTFARGAAPRVTVFLGSRVCVEGRGRVPGVSGHP
eukprot:1082847-Prymnesium_polylepis.1